MSIYESESHKLFAIAAVTEKKVFIRFTPLVNVLKRFIFETSNEAVFVHGKPFQLNRIFTGKAGAYQNRSLVRCSHLGLAPGHFC